MAARVSSAPRRRCSAGARKGGAAAAARCRSCWPASPARAFCRQCAGAVCTAAAAAVRPAGVARLQPAAVGQAAAINMLLILLICARNNAPACNPPPSRCKDEQSKMFGAGCSGARNNIGRDRKQLLSARRLERTGIDWSTSCAGGAAWELVPSVPLSLVLLSANQNCTDHGPLLAPRGECVHCLLESHFRGTLAGHNKCSSSHGAHEHAAILLAQHRVCCSGGVARLRHSRAVSAQRRCDCHLAPGVPRRRCDREPRAQWPTLFTPGSFPLWSTSPLPRSRWRCWATWALRWRWPPTSCCCGCAAAAGGATARACCKAGLWRLPGGSHLWLHREPCRGVAGQRARAVRRHSHMPWRQAGAAEGRSARIRLCQQTRPQRSASVWQHRWGCQQTRPQRCCHMLADRCGLVC